MYLNLVKKDNYDDFYKLKSENSNIFWTGWNEKPDYDNLKKFFNNVIDNNKTIKDRKIYLAYENDIVIGYAYIDYVNGNIFHISPGISEKYQGKGYGKKLIGLVLEEGLKLGFKSAEAYIREDNIASQKCFISNGFVETDVFENKFIPNQNRQLKMIRYLLKN